MTVLVGGLFTAAGGAAGVAPILAAGVVVLTLGGLITLALAAAMLINSIIRDTSFTPEQRKKLEKFNKDLVTLRKILPTHKRELKKVINDLKEHNLLSRKYLEKGLAFCTLCETLSKSYAQTCKPHARDNPKLKARAKFCVDLLMKFHAVGENFQKAIKEADSQITKADSQVKKADAVLE